MNRSTRLIELGRILAEDPDLNSVSDANEFKLELIQLLLVDNSIDSIESTLTNSLRTAAERFEQHVKDLRQGINGMETLNSEARDRLAQQFAAQHKEAVALANAINTHGLVSLITSAR